MSSALIIDDNKNLADSLQKMLGLLSIDAKVALGSRAGISTLQQGAPDMVFLDINMPGISGFEVLAYIRREPALADVPVIIVTSDDQPETIQKANDEGAKAIVIKPITMEAIETALLEAKILKDE